MGMGVSKGESGLTKLPPLSECCDKSVRQPVDWQDIRRRNEAFKQSGYCALGTAEASGVAALEADVVSRALAALSWLR